MQTKTSKTPFYLRNQKCKIKAFFIIENENLLTLTKKILEKAENGTSVRRKSFSNVTRIHITAGASY